MSQRDAPRRARPSLCAFALAAASLLGCDGEPRASAPGDRPLVAVSVAPHAWFVERLAGGAVDVVSLLPPGASPTSYEPDFALLRAIEGASLVVRVGHPDFPFERAWLDPLLRDRSDLASVDAHASAPRGDGRDPHEWLSPVAAGALVDALEPELARLLGDPDVVHARAEALRREIASLDAELAAALAPVRGGHFLALHPAWGHFADHYGLTQLAIERDGKPPGARELAGTIEQARALGLRSVIVPPQQDPAQARSVADAIGGRIVVLDPLARDWLAAMRATAGVLATEAVPL